jgi:hypothetical protein
MSRRTRYYGYAARGGGVIWLTRSLHAFVQERPHTVGHHQCTHYLGQTRLMSLEEWRDTRRVKATAAVG